MLAFNAHLSEDLRRNPELNEVSGFILFHFLRHVKLTLPVLGALFGRWVLQCH